MMLFRVCKSVCVCVRGRGTKLYLRLEMASKPKWRRYKTNVSFYCSNGSRYITILFLIVPMFDCSEFLDYHRFLKFRENIIKYLCRCSDLLFFLFLFRKVVVFQRPFEGL